MNNKILFAPVAFLIIALSLFISCGDDDKEFKNVAITAVEKLYEPANNKSIILDNVKTVFFEWERAKAEDNSIVYYEVIFFKTDVNNPEYIAVTDNMGAASSLTLTAKEMNRIAGYMNISIGEYGTFNWTVRSNRGLNSQIAKQTNEITIKRIDSIDLEGEDLMIGGDGAEDGHTFGINEDDQYQIWTKIEGGKPFYFYAGDRTFYLRSDGKLVETTDQETKETNSVSQDGFYRITLDPETASGSTNFEKVEEVQIIWDPTDQSGVLSDLFVYEGKGLWTLRDFHFILRETGWGHDPVEKRFKFVVTVDGNKEGWAGKQDDPKHVTLEEVEYFYLYPSSGGNNLFNDGNLLRFPYEVAGDENNNDKYYGDILFDTNAVSNAKEDYPMMNRYENIREK